MPIKLEYLLSTHSRTRSMKGTPAGWPRITSALFYTDARASIDWLCRAFGFEVRLLVEGEGGSIEHCEALLRRSNHHGRPAGPRDAAGGPPHGEPALDWRRQYPASVGLRRRRRRPLHQGPRRGRRDLPRAGDERLRLGYAMDRTYGALDPDGHLWFFMQRLRDPPPVSPA